MKKKEMNEEKFKEQMKWLNRIWVTAIGECPKKIQFRQFYRVKEDPKSYEEYQGSFVHKLFDRISKQASLDRKDIYKEVLRSQIDIPQEFRARLYIVGPIYEERIKEFFRNDRIGKESFRSCFSLEKALEAPVKDFKLNLPFSNEVLEKYLITGKIDFLSLVRLLEVKSGSKVKGEHFRQAIIYQKMAKIAGIKGIGYFLIYLGKGGPFRRKASLRHWDYKQNKNKLLEQSREGLIRTITQREKLRQNPYCDFPDWTPKSSECRYCHYRTACRSRFLKLKHRIVKWFKA